MEFVGKQRRFTEEQQTTILNHFIDGGDRSCGGVMHAVASTAQTLENADGTYNMELRGMRAMILTASFQQ